MFKHDHLFFLLLPFTISFWKQKCNLKSCESSIMSHRKYNAMGKSA